MDAATLGLIGTALVAGGTAAGAWLSRRTSATTDTTTTTDTHSQSQTVAVDVDKLVELAIAGYRDEVDRLKARVGTLEQKVANNRIREAEDKAAISRLQRQVNSLSSEVELLREWVRAQGVDPEAVVQSIAAIADAVLDDEDET